MVPGEALGQEVKKKKRVCLGVNAGPDPCTPHGSPLLSMFPSDPRVYLGRRERCIGKVIILLLSLSQLILVTTESWVSDPFYRVSEKLSYLHKVAQPVRLSWERNPATWGPGLITRCPTSEATRSS